jgi:myo-inositol 2-dehydrogenase/D-chiro-inositol 1-dehydrogenase
MNQRRLRIGLVGFGAWGQLHAQSIVQNPRAELVAIATASSSSAETAKARFPQAWVTTDYRELCGHPAVDLVDIVTPSHTHRHIAEAAISQKKHLLLEKPLATTLQDCLALVRAAEAQGIHVAVGHELRLSSQWGTIKDIIDQGTIGDPKYVLVELSRKPYRLGADGWRYDRQRVGSWVLEEPIHFFDLARWYLSSQGEAIELQAWGNSLDSQRSDLYDNFTAVMRYPQGSYAVVSQTLGAFEHHQTVKVTGTRGAIWAGWSGAMDRTLEPTYFLKVFDGHSVEEVALERHSGEVFELREEIDRTIRMVLDGLPPIASIRDGLWSAGLCLIAEESIRQGRALPIRESHMTGNGTDQQKNPGPS